MLYSKLRRMMDTADCVGKVEKVTLGDWIMGQERILIEGTCGEGKFELELTYKPKEEKDGN